MAFSTQPPSLKPKTLGILTGISYQSGIDYYKCINEQYLHLVPQNPEHPMPPNPRIVMISLDCAPYAAALVARKWPETRELLWREGLEKLARMTEEGYIDYIVLASNTAHISIDRELVSTNPLYHSLYEKTDQKFLHIADCTAAAIRRELVEKHDNASQHSSTKKPGPRLIIGLLGTEPTMRENYLKDRLLQHKFIEKIVVPHNDEDLHKIFHYIMTELGAPSDYDSSGRPVFKEATREYFKARIRELVVEQNCAGVILGCTEIELLIRQEDVPEVALFPSAQLHIEAAAKVTAGVTGIGEYLPGGSSC